jgi:hypothetical protein
MMATVGTSFSVLHKKIGGHASGGRYSEPHTWSELIPDIPFFISYFLVILFGTLAYQALSANKETAICPSCGHVFETDNIEFAYCPKCGVKAEIIDGFYNRHPDLK